MRRSSWLEAEYSLQTGRNHEWIWEVFLWSKILNFDWFDLDSERWWTNLSLGKGRRMKNNRRKDLQVFSWFIPLFFSSFLFSFYENLSITMQSPFPPFMSTMSMRSNLTGVRLLLVADSTSALIGSYDRYTWDFSHVGHRQSLSHQKETPPVTPWAWRHPARFQFARREEYSRSNPRSHWPTGVTTLIAMEVRKGKNMRWSSMFEQLFDSTLLFIFFVQFHPTCIIDYFIYLVSDVIDEGITMKNIWNY